METHAVQKKEKKKQIEMENENEKLNLQALKTERPDALVIMHIQY